MRPAASVVAALTSLVALTGCAGTKAVTPGPSRDVLLKVRTALAKGEGTCSQKDDVILCETGPNTPDFIVLYDEPSRRLLFGTSLPIRRPCAEVLVVINAYNQSVDVAQAACQHQKVAFVSPVLIPEGGLSARDLLAYRQWWTVTLVRSLRASGLLELVGDDEDDAPAGQQAHGTIEQAAARAQKPPRACPFGLPAHYCDAETYTPAPAPGVE